MSILKSLFSLAIISAVAVAGQTVSAQVAISGYQLGTTNYGVTSSYGTTGYALSSGRIVGFQPAQLGVANVHATTGLQLSGLQAGGLQVVNLPTTGIAGIQSLNRNVTLAPANVAATTVGGFAAAGVVSPGFATTAHAAPAGVPGRLVKYYYRVPVYGVRTKAAAATTTVTPAPCNVCTPTR